MTLADVAASAGVSPATASRALSNDPRITEPTRLAVRRAADQLGYVPNAAARSLRVRRTRTLGLLLADFADPVHGQVAAGFELEAATHGYTVTFVAGLNDPAQERRALGVFVEQGTDGVALVSSVLDPREAQERSRERVVIVQPDHEGVRRNELTPGVIETDDAAGVELAVRHLIELGYRDIAYFGAGDRPSNRLRRDTAERVLAEHGLEPGPRLGVSVDAWSEPAAVVRALPADLPRAFVCYDDKLALALLDALRARGVRVPADVGVTGFDGIPFAALSNPRLTTVWTPTAEMGRIAARSLIHAIQDGQPVPGRVLPVELVVRESTRRQEAPGA